jgi:tellurite methyltransferase
MEPDPRAIWNKKYTEAERSFEPDPFLVKAYSQFLANQPPGDALDIAGGAGRNALWLAQRGWRVRLIDVSEAAIALVNENVRKLLPGSAQDEMSARSGQVETEQLDLSSTRDLGNERFDLVLVFFYLQRELFPAMVTALKPGGYLVFKTFTVAQQRLGKGPQNPTYLLQPLELREAFPSLQVLHYNESVTSVATAELVARKMP